MKNIKLIILFLIVIATVRISDAQTSNQIDLSKALKIGDTFIPPSTVQVMRGLDKTIDWKKLNDKVVILDFFDTYCGSCIQSMPKLQKLQDQLKDKLQIINVGWQDKGTLEKFYSSNEFLKENKVNLPVIYSDTYLKDRFPHQGVPHVVFLYKGKVQAITGNKLITEENILSLFDKGRIDLPLKNDYGKGDLMVEQTDDNAKVKEGVWISGYQDGVPFQSLIIKKDSITGLIKTSFYNVSIYSAILFNWAKVKPANYIPRPERLILKVKDPNRYEDQSNLGEVWYTKNAISYERLDRIQRPDSVQASMVLNDLHSFFGIRSYRSMEKITCLIFKSCPVIPYTGKIITGNMTYDNISVFATMTDLNYQFPPALIQVDGNDKLIIGDYANLQELNEQLGAYGIKAVVGDGEMEVLVIEEVAN